VNKTGEMKLIDFLTHYYRAGNRPFMTLSALEDHEALAVMKEKYSDDPMWARFKNPGWYLSERKRAEKWLRDRFISKGGNPKQDYPIYTVLGTSEALDKELTTQKLERIEIPLSLLAADEVSFTFIDSMFTIELGEKKTPEYYQERYHGKVFTLNEIEAIIAEKGEPSGNWWGNLPADFFPYIEAQIWNHEKLIRFYENMH
jgi:hypothetical protein